MEWSVPPVSGWLWRSGGLLRSCGGWWWDWFSNWGLSASSLHSCVSTYIYTCVSKPVPGVWWVHPVSKLQSTASLWAFFMTIVSCFLSVLQGGGTPGCLGFLSFVILSWGWIDVQEWGLKTIEGTMLQGGTCLQRVQASTVRSQEP